MTIEKQSRRGGALVAALTLLVVVMVTTGVLLRQVAANQRATRDLGNKLQAQWLAESALERAAAKLHMNHEYKGEVWQPIVAADVQCSVTIAVTKSADEEVYNLQVTAIFPDHPVHRAQVISRRKLQLK